MLNDSKGFQEILHEVLDKRLNAKSNQELILQTILKKKDKGITSDFQQMLNENIKPLYEDKLKKELEPKEKKVDSIKKKQDIAHQVKSGANIEKISRDIDKKENEEEIGKKDSKNSVNSSNELTVREETLKYMYSVALEEYHTLRENLYKYQIRDNDIAVDDRNYLKLLKYENYLRKCDTVFKASTGSYISNQDEEISKKENKYAYEESKSERKVVNEHEDSINEVDSLNLEIENKADEIIALNDSAANGNVQDYEVKLDLLENEYIKLNAKMHLLKPNILELYRQEEQKQEQEQITTRVVGTMYGEKKDKYVLDKQVVRLDKKVEGKENSLDDAAETEKNELEETNEKLANSYIDAADTALDENDTKEAIYLVDKAEKLVGNKEVKNITSDKKSDFTAILKSNVSSGDGEGINNEIENQTDAIDKHLSDVENKTISLSPVQEECAKAVNSPEKRAENVIAREEKEEANKDIVKQIEQIR